MVSTNGALAFGGTEFGSKLPCPGAPVWLTGLCVNHCLFSQMQLRKNASRGIDFGPVNSG